LSTNPGAQEKIYQETCDMNWELTQREISSAHYTRAAIHEAFRLSPAAFAVARILEEDFYLSDYHIKPGVRSETLKHRQQNLNFSHPQTVVLCQNMVACSKNENFDNASEYIPERWINSTGEFDSCQCRGSSITLPFGSGKRMCPGQKYTELELMILVIKLVRSFKIKYHSEFERQFEFILAPKTPVNIQFCDRYLKISFRIETNPFKISRIFICSVQSIHIKILSARVIHVRETRNFRD
jgi:ecdysone 20-monooxygenase